MIVLVARYKALPGRGDEVEATLVDMADRVETYEPDCLLYQVCRAQNDPDSFLLYEQYLDEEAVQFHRQTSHFQGLVVEKIIPMLASREVDFYELVAG